MQKFEDGGLVDEDEVGSAMKGVDALSDDDAERDANGVVVRAKSWKGREVIGRAADAIRKRERGGKK